MRDLYDQVYSIPLHSSVHIGLVTDSAGKEGGKEGHNLQSTMKVEDIMAMQVRG